MVFPDGYKFYDPIPNMPKTEESEKPLLTTAAPDNSDNKKSVRIKEEAVNEDEPIITKPLTLTRSRTRELSRVKKQERLRPLDRFFDVVSHQAPVVKGIVVLLATSLPFLIFVCIAYSIPQGSRGINNLTLTLRTVSIWVLTCWASFMTLLYLGLALSALADYICTLSSTLDRYRGLARAICTRSTLLGWAGAVYGLIPDLLQSEGPSTETDKAIANTRKFFSFMMVAFGIILLQGILLQLIKIQYIEGFIGPRAAKAHHELQVIKELNHLVSRHIEIGDAGMLSKIFKKLFQPTNTRDLYYIISRGEGDEDKWNEYASGIWATIAGGKESLVSEDICKQLISVNRDPTKGRDLFLELDNSLDGEVTEDEVTALVHRTGLQLNRRTQAMAGIKHLTSKLETFMTILTFLLIIFVYAQIFDPSLGTRLGSLWTGLVGLAFAFSGSVAEFVNATVFCFGKHPYDVGDFIEIKDKKYVVSKIYLTHTQFEQVQNEHVRGLVCQMSHASLQTEPITNWTRTVEDATKRHAESASKKDDKNSTREEEIARLVSAKLGYLQRVELAKTTAL